MSPMSPTRARTLAAPAAVLALAVALAVSAAAQPGHGGGTPTKPASGKKALTMQEAMELNNAVADSARAPLAVRQLRQYLASDPDSMTIPFARRALFRGLVTTKAPTAEIIAQADTTGPLLAQNRDKGAAIGFYADAAQVLQMRKEELPTALRFAHTANALVPDDPRVRNYRVFAQASLGMALLSNGRADSAIMVLEGIRADYPDSQWTLRRLGDAYVGAGKPDPAIDHYVRSETVFLGRDTTAIPELRATYRKRHGSLKGLDAKLDAARTASRKFVALDSRRFESTPPDWRLPAMTGDTLAFADLKGKVTLLNFWGSWCGPCRTELPQFEKIYRRFKDRGVAFVGLNWEQPGPAEQREQKAREYYEKAGYTFPTVFDHDRVAVDGFDLEGFPTLYVIDPGGRVRYRNVGASEGIDQIMAAQIESLLQ